MGTRAWLDTRLAQWCETYQRTLAVRSQSCVYVDHIANADKIAFAAATLTWGPMMERCKVKASHGYVPTALSDNGASDIRCGLCALAVPSVPTPRT